jgi:hypothetical protein
LRWGFQLLTARQPDRAERQQLATLLERRMVFYRAQEEAAKAYLSALQKDPAPLAGGQAGSVAELAAYANVASLLLNLDETITRN